MNAGKMRQKTEDGYLLAEKTLGMDVSPFSDQWPVCSSTHTLPLTPSETAIIHEYSGQG